MIVTEKEKTKVIFSSLLDRHYPVLYNQLCEIMWNYHTGLGCVSHTSDYWARDYMPIQTDENVFVKFTFNPDYLQDKKRYITDVDKVINNCPFVKDFVFVNIPLKLEGGNMVFCKRRMSSDETIPYVVMTEKTLVENPEYSKEQIESILKCAFQAHNLSVVWLPWDREDTFGHTDGIVRYVGVDKSGRAKVLVNLELYEDEIADQMYEALAKHFDVVELRLSEYEDLSWAYINCLQTEDFIIVPGIGNAVTDAEAMKQYHELFPEYEDNIYMVQMREFIAEQGGALNCLTWTFYENTLKTLLNGKYEERKGSDKNNVPVQITFEAFTKDLAPF